MLKYNLMVSLIIKAFAYICLSSIASFLIDMGLEGPLVNLSVISLPQALKGGVLGACKGYSCVCWGKLYAS